MTRTEQETRRSAPARGAGTPQSGERRSGAAAKPVPRPRPAASAPEPTRDDLRTRDGAREARGAQARSAEIRTAQVRRGEQAGAAADVLDAPAESTRGKRPVSSRSGVRGGRTARPEGVRRPPGGGRRGPSRRQRGPFLVLVLGLLGGGLVTLLLLNTVLAQDFVRATELKREIAQIQQGNENSSVELNKLKQPAKVAERGEQLNLRQDWDKTNVITPATENSDQVSTDR
ncbi:hypothetical protein [Nonomuraea typhae]|uniref:hypothetical protein n=1 Tax=Nonomuraea typhae TaxID=2603600 RepID=UPI0012F9F29B|nr:hypothetical protein [Nonomuraea typhae]